MEHKTSENTKLDTDVFKLEQKWHKLGLDEMEENPARTGCSALFVWLSRRIAGILVLLPPSPMDDKILVVNEHTILALIKVSRLQPSYDLVLSREASWMIPPAGVHPDYRGSGAASGKIDPNKLGCLLSGPCLQPLSLATAPQLC